MLRYLVILLALFLCGHPLIACDYLFGEHAVAEKQFVVFALKRSGHHAILNWIAKQQRGSTYALDNAFYHTRTSHFRSSETERNDGLQHALVSGKVSRSYQDGELKNERVNRQETAVSSDLIETWMAGIHQQEKQSITEFSMRTPLGLYMINFEDYALDQAALLPWKALERARPIDQVVLLIIRDPLNQIASRLTKGFDAGPRFREQWKEYARWALDRPNVRKLPSESSTVVIPYNRWFTDPAFRRELAETLDLDFTDAGIDDVPSEAGGSSFDQQTFQGQAQKMQVLERWKSMQDKQEIIDALSDAELIGLSKALFGDLYSAHGSS